MTPENNTQNLAVDHPVAHHFHGSGHRLHGGGRGRGGALMSQQAKHRAGVAHGWQRMKTTPAKRNVCRFPSGARPPWWVMCCHRWTAAPAAP